MLQFGKPFRKSTLQTKYHMLDFLKSIRQSSISLNNVLLFQDLILPLGLEVVLLEFYHNFRIFFTHYDSTHKKQLLLYYWARKLQKHCPGFKRTTHELQLSARSLALSSIKRSLYGLHDRRRRQRPLLLLLLQLRRVDRGPLQQSYRSSCLCYLFVLIRGCVIFQI